MSELSFEQLLTESMKDIHTGDIVTGKVISVREDQIALNIGYKADGILKREDYSRNQELDLRTVANVDDEIQVKIKKLNDGEGQVVLSCRELLQSRLNEKLKELYESGEIQKGKVIEVNAGGLMVEIEPEVVVFIPNSLVSNKPNEKFESYKGQQIEFYISEFNPIRHRCIGDRKRILVAEEKKKREEAFSKIKEGMIVEGAIKSILKYGVFVDLGGVDGLLYITEMGWGKIQSPSKIYKVGDKIKVLVREITDGKISLTMKFPEENPWLKAKSNYALGNVVKGKVARIVPYGAFVSLDDNIDALLHISQISNEKVAKVEDVLSIGQEIEAKVISFDEHDKKISLSMKALLPEPEKEEEADVVDIDIETYGKQLEEEN